MDTNYDVIIIGAGPAGLSFARSIAESGLSILVLERSSLITLQNPPEDGREIALTHLSVRLMKEAGVWQRLADSEVSPIEAARVFDGESSYSLDFDKEQTHLAALGYLVPNHCIRRACFEAIQEYPSVEIRTEATVENVSTNSVCGTVELNTGEILTAKLVVAADTRFSEMRRKMGLSASLKDFSRTAIVCRMEHSIPHNQTAFECFHYGRTTAILPMTGNRSSIVVTVNSREAQRFAEMPEAEFNHDIEQQLQGMLGKVSLIGKRHVYPLVAVHANQFVTQRFALVGDAAVGMHPVTAHGFNLGLRGQSALADVVIKAVEQNQDIGDLILLKKYETEQMRVTRVMYHGTNVVVGLFTHEARLAKVLRQVTLRVANNLPPLKNYIRNSLTEDSLERHFQPESPIAFLPALPGVKALQKIGINIADKIKPLSILNRL